jgi:hypothetical protein
MASIVPAAEAGPRFLELRAVRKSFGHVEVLKGLIWQLLAAKLLS